MNDRAKELIVREVVEEIYTAFPELWDQHEESGYEKAIEYNFHHLEHLETTYEMDDINFFLDYADWLDNVLRRQNVETYVVIDNFERLVRLIPEHVEPEEETAYLFYLESAVEILQTRQDGEQI
ncbi:hypothetical protein D7Z54_15825 [Salibacterium salarium]|uniref:Uncharacterized protein n=1 Tax=Salibacterium salarium TaxID=284579 RepID=A0A3R9QSF5_9BACI|nr:hypothetical protein [Salibacterium salarium]RSL32364.1 hypothetical protein D7Z54_15825 [Salibacterium salarium]